MSDNNTSILQDDFTDIEIGDSVLDRLGREWIAYGVRDAVYTRGSVILLQCSGYDRDSGTDGFYWEGEKIICDDVDEGPYVSMDFNFPGARIIKKSVGSLEGQALIASPTIKKSVGSLEGHAFISKTFREDGGDNIPRTCGLCLFANNDEGESPLRDCTIVGGSAKKLFGIPLSDVMPKKIGDEPVGHYCPHWVHFACE